MPTYSLTRAITHSLTRKPTDPGVGGGFNPASLFAAGEQGAWYDPSDLSTMFQDSAGSTPVTAVEQPVGKILDKSGRGNHASQATSASRPVLSARKNLTTNSEAQSGNFGGASGGVTAVDGIARPMGTGRVLRRTTGAISYAYGNAAPTANATIAASCYVRRSDGAPLVFGAPTLANSALNDCVLVINGAGITPNATTVEDAGGGWYRLSASAVYTSNSIGFISYNTTVVLDITGLQIEYGSAAGTYQRVTTSSDYDTAGFPHYFALDRVDDHVTAAAGGGGTTGICVCAAIRAGGAGNARTIWSDRGTNTGYRLSINASNQLVLSAGNGSAHTEVVGPTVTASTDYVVTGWHDGTNLNVQLNAGAATSAAFSTATAGTSGFTIGKDNGAATGYYGERIYEIVYRKNDTSNAGDRTSLIAYMAEQAKITL